MLSNCALEISSLVSCFLPIWNGLIAFESSLIMPRVSNYTFQVNFGKKNLCGFESISYSSFYSRALSFFDIVEILLGNYTVFRFQSFSNLNIILFLQEQSVTLRRGRGWGKKFNFNVLQSRTVSWLGTVELRLSRQFTLCRWGTKDMGVLGVRLYQALRAKGRGSRCLKGWVMCLWGWKGFIV